MERLERERRSPCHCGRTCRLVTIVVGFHAFMGLILTAALTTRLYLYRDVTYTDMPGDMRFLRPEISSVFCARHMARADLVSGNNPPREQFSNTVRKFDVYIFDENVEDRLPRVWRRGQLQGIGALESGSYEYHAFYFLNGSNAEVEICNDLDACSVGSDNRQESPASLDGAASRGNLSRGVWAAVVRGQSDFRLAQDQLANQRWPCGADVECLRQVFVNTSDCGGAGLNLDIGVANVTDDYYFLFFNPAESQLCQKYRYKYNYTRSVYSTKGAPQGPKEVSTFGTDQPQRSFLLDFHYSLNARENALYTLAVTYTCDPAVMVYVGVFFAIPFVLVIVALLAFCCCCYGDSSGRYSSLSYSEDYGSATSRSSDAIGNQQNVSYGTTAVR